jgi:serine/threonine-protein kinase
MTQVARAMTKAHEAGIVHRDLKPDNIFIVRNDEEEIAKVLDFGVAKSHTHGVGAVSSATRTGSVLGTPYYMSPEQAEGSKSVDHRTDIWAMGVIAWECLLGARPFEAETLGGLLLAICAREIPAPSRMGAVPAGFDAWFARACSRDLNYRFATAKEAAAELRNVCAGQMMAGGYAPPPQGPQAAVQAASLPLASTTAHLGLSTSSPQPKKSAAPWIVMGVAAVAAVGGGAFFALRGSNDQNEAVASAAPTAATPSAAVAAAPPVAAEPEKPAPAPVASASATPSATAAPAAAAPAAAAPAVAAPVAAAPRVKPRVAAAAVPDKPKPAAAPAPAPAPAQPAVKPRVNLGI